MSTGTKGEDGVAGSVSGYVFVSSTIALAEGARLNVCGPMTIPEDPGKRVWLEISNCEEAGLIVYVWEPTTMAGGEIGVAGD